MSSSRAALTDADIRTLVRGPTEDERAAAAHKLCRRIDAGVSEDERSAAQEVLRLMAADAAELVRRALAVTLKNSPELPREVALRLASDVDSVALPVLTHSPVFNDEDLCEIVRAMGEVKQLAVAKRPTLSEKVTTAIADHAGPDAVKAAISNDNATFSEAGLRKVVDRFAEMEAITTSVAFRAVLPLSISERLVSLVSDQVRQHLLDNHALSPETALQIAIGARERATVDLVDQAGRAADMRAFVSHLNRQQRLTPSLMIRALASGHMTFFEWAIAELSGVAHHRTWMMIHDAGPLGFKAIYDRTGLPDRLFPAFRIGIDTYHILQLDGDVRDKTVFQERMLQRFLTQPQSAPREDVDYLLDKMDRAPPVRRAVERKGAGRAA